MCLAQLLQIIKIDHEHSNGTVNLNGTTLTVGLDLVPEVRVGDFVLVHAGMAIERVNLDDVEVITELYETFIHNDDSCSPYGSSIP